MDVANIKENSENGKDLITDRIFDKLKTNEESENFPLFKILNGEFYFRHSTKKADGSDAWIYHQDENPVKKMWEIIRTKTNGEIEKVYGYFHIENLLRHCKINRKTYVVLIIHRLNTILRDMHDQLEEGTVITDLGKKIDEEMKILEEIMEIVYDRKESQKKTEFQKKIQFQNIVENKDDKPDLNLFSSSEKFEDYLNEDTKYNLEQKQKEIIITDLKTEEAIIYEFAKFGFWQIFTKNLKRISMGAVKKFQKDIEAEEIQAEFFSFQCDSLFVTEAEKSLPTCHSDWSYKEERAELRDLMVKKILMLKQVQTVKLRAAENQSYSFQLLQQQQAQLHAIQQQQYGGVSTNWNIGIAYRPPDSIFNISAGYQQGKANIQISMVPDEQASLLGATGFTAGVGPGNLGLSLNLNI